MSLAEDVLSGALEKRRGMELANQINSHLRDHSTGSVSTQGDTASLVQGVVEGTLKAERK